LIVRKAVVEMTVELSVTDAGLIVTFNPAGDEDAERFIGPLNPLRPVTITAVSPIVPALSCRNERTGLRLNEVPVT
jgi:hypothetical protein